MQNAPGKAQLEVNLVDSGREISRVTKAAKVEKAKLKNAAKDAKLKNRLALIAETAENGLVLANLQWKTDVELLGAQQLPTRNPGFVAPAPNPEGFEQNEPHFAWIVKKLGAGAQGTVVLADVSTHPIHKEPSLKLARPLHAIRLYKTTRR
jgi:hypothetical protein